MQSASFAYKPTRTRSTPYDPAADIVRPRHLPQAVGLSEITIRRWRQRGEFPEPIRLGPQAIGWRRIDIDAWLASRRPANESAAARNGSRR